MIEVKPEKEGLIEINFQLPWQEFEPFVQQAGKKLSLDLEIPGFRRGQAPLSLIEQKLGWEKIYREAAFSALENSWKQIVQTVTTETIGRPSVEITKLAAGNDLEIKLKVIKRPQVQLPDYRSVAKNLAVARPKDFPVSEQELNIAVEWLQRSRASYVAVSRPAQHDDYLEIHFNSKIAGNPVEKGSSAHHPFILGQGRFMPGFEEQLVGLRQGETKEFSLQAPADYPHIELAGKTVDFTVGIDSVQEVILPVLNDEFAQRIGKFSSIGELRQSVKQGLSEEKRERERREFEDRLIGELVKQTKLKIPELLIEQEAQSSMSDVLARLEKSGVDLEKYLKQTNQTVKQLSASVKEQAEQNLKIAFILQEIAKCEELKADPKEIDQTIEQHLQKHGSIKEVKKAKIDLAQERVYAENELLNRKVIQFLVESAPK